MCSNCFSVVIFLWYSHYSHEITAMMYISLYLLLKVAALFNSKDLIFLKPFNSPSCTEFHGAVIVNTGYSRQKGSAHIKEQAHRGFLNYCT